MAGDSETVDMRGRTCVVTGANTGIGKEIARGLARLQANVILACRDVARGTAARDELAADTGNSRLVVERLDLSDQASVRAFVELIGSKYDRLNVLVNNAGVWMKKKTGSVQGIEMTWATNVLGPFLLTDLLIPQLSASSSDELRGRIVNVASTYAGGLNVDDPEFDDRHFSGKAAYRQSKQANRMLTWELDQRLPGTGLTANALHPGFIASELSRHLGPVSRLAWRTAKPPAEGADTAIWLASEPQIEGLSGGWFINRKEEKCDFRHLPSCELVADICAEMVGIQ